MFITFEGIEGCGKTTQIKLLADHLKKIGEKVLLTREPGGCPISDQIRTILLDAKNKKMVPSTELMLYCASRSQHIAEVIKPALEKKIHVLCDRFSDATTAYQHFARGVDRTDLEMLNQFAVQGLKPDLTILIDTPVSIGLPRAKRRINACNGAKEERFELESDLFHQCVRDGYLQLAKEEGDRFIIIDGTLTIESMAEVIAKAVIPRIRGI